MAADHIKLPRLGWLKLKERGYLPADKKILSATVSERAGRWFVSLQVEENHEHSTPPETACGVDVGITHLATLDDGTTFDNPKALLKWKRTLQRQLKYKAEWHGGQVIEADRFYPSSKTCSRCNWRHPHLKLSDRIFHCERCGFTIDRDQNAAINLKPCTVSSTES